MCTQCGEWCESLGVACWDVIAGFRKSWHDRRGLHDEHRLKSNALMPIGVYHQHYLCLSTHYKQNLLRYCIYYTIFFFFLSSNKRGD